MPRSSSIRRFAWTAGLAHITRFIAGATTTGEGDGGQLNAGLFGAVNVEPRGADWLRSQVTAEDVDLVIDAGWSVW